MRLVRQVFPITCLLIIGCVSTSPNGSERIESAEIEYFLNKSVLSISTTFSLKSCTYKQNPNAKPLLRPTVDVEATITPTAVPDVNNPSSLDAMALRSASEKRALTVELFPNQTLKSISSTSTDQTFTIIGNTLKVVGNLLGLGLFTSGPKLASTEQTRLSVTCTEDTQKVIEDVNVMLEEIDRLRSLVADSSASTEDRLRTDKLINALAARVAYLRLSKLTKTYNRTVAIAPDPNESYAHGWTQEALTKWTFAEFKDWIELSADKTQMKKLETSDQDLALQDLTTRFSQQKDDILLSIIKQHPLFRIDANFINPGYQPDLQITSINEFRQSLASEGGPCYKSVKNEGEKNGCINRYLTSHVIYRETPVVQTNLTVHMLNGMTEKPAGGNIAEPGITASYRQIKSIDSMRIPVTHLGPIKAIPMNATLGDNYSVGLSFDPLGRRTKLNWNSEATAANVTGGLATSLEGLKGVIDANASPTTTEEQQVEIDRLSIEYKYNKYKACKAIIEAGGTECPEID